MINPKQQAIDQSGNYITVKTDTIATHKYEYESKNVYTIIYIYNSALHWPGSFIFSGMCPSNAAGKAGKVQTLTRVTKPMEPNLERAL